jgi:uncharacterized protein (DUF1778 family)
MLEGCGTMTIAMDRLVFWVTPQVKQRLEEAARAAGQPLTNFVLGAAQDRADEVLTARTVVPPDYFDQLIDALSASAEPSEPLRRAVERAASVVEQIP